MTEPKSKIRYLPRVGLHYGSSPQFGMKILIIGESHYEYEEESGRRCQDDEGLTRRVFGDFSNITNPFRSKVAAAVLGRSVKDVDAELYRSFWESVAVYNYVRRLLKNEKAKPADFRDPEAAEAFKEVLSSLQPDCVFVFSKRVWNQLPDFDRADSEIEKEIGREAGWYNCGSDLFALAVGLTHPSYWNREGSTPLSTHEFVERAMRRCEPNASLPQLARGASGG